MRAPHCARPMSGPRSSTNGPGNSDAVAFSLLVLGAITIIALPSGRIVAACASVLVDWRFQHYRRSLAENCAQQAVRQSGSLPQRHRRALTASTYTATLADAASNYDSGVEERFIEEAQTLARFVHPNIVRVYRYFRANNTGYMVLHFEEGRSFKAWLKALGRAPRQKELDKILVPAARCAGDDPQGRLPASRHRARQHHHPQGRAIPC